MATLYPFDANALLHAGAAITATGVGSVPYYDVGADARFSSASGWRSRALTLPTTTP